MNPIFACELFNDVVARSDMMRATVGIGGLCTEIRLLVAEVATMNEPGAEPRCHVTNPKAVAEAAQLLRQWASALEKAPK